MKDPINNLNPNLWATNSDLYSFGKSLVHIASSDFIVVISGPTGSGKGAMVNSIGKMLAMDIIGPSKSEFEFGALEYFEDFESLLNQSTREEPKLIVIPQDNDHIVSVVSKEYIEAIRSNGTKVILTIDEVDPELPDRLASNCFTHLKMGYLNPAQCMLGFAHFFNETPPAIIQTFTSLTPGLLAGVKAASDRDFEKWGSTRIVEELHDRVQQKRIALSRGGEQLGLRSISLDDRYKSLEKLSRPLRWEWVKACYQSLDRAHSETPSRQPQQRVSQPDQKMQHGLH